MNKKDNISFEQGLSMLEATVSRLEAGELSLDESLAEFEKAVHLVKLCGIKLDEAKQKVRILTEAPDGSMTDAPFKSKDNED